MKAARTIIEIDVGNIYERTNMTRIRTEGRVRTSVIAVPTTPTRTRNAKEQQRTRVKGVEQLNGTQEEENYL